MKDERDSDLPTSPPTSPRSSSNDADFPAEIRGVELSPDALSPAALRGLIEEFVSREGTDYGHVDRALEGKVADVYRQIESGDARIVFDLESETASIVSARDLPPSESR